MEKLLTPAEVARDFRVSLSMIRQKIFSQAWPCVRIGRRVFFRQQDVEKILEEGFQPARDPGR